MRHSDGGGFSHNKREEPGRRRLGEAEAHPEVSQWEKVSATEVDCRQCGIAKVVC